MRRREACLCEVRSVWKRKAQVKIRLGNWRADSLTTGCQQADSLPVCALLTRFTVHLSTSPSSRTLPFSPTTLRRRAVAINMAPRHWCCSRFPPNPPPGRHDHPSGFPLPLGGGAHSHLARKRKWTKMNLKFVFQDCVSIVRSIAGEKMAEMQNREISFPHPLIVCSGRTTR